MTRWDRTPYDLLLQVPKLKAAKANIRLDFMFADVMKQQGWVKEATLLFVHTNFSAVDLRELRTRAGGMQVQHHHPHPHPQPNRRV